MTNDTTQDPSAAWLVTGLLVLTLVIRGVALWAMRANLQNDPDAYREIAENLLRHGEFATGSGDQIRPTAYRPPLYPVVLSNLPSADGQGISLTQTALLHLALGVATVWLTWLTCRLWLPGLAPLVAGFLVACDPILLNQQSLIMTETLATFLAILSLWCLARFTLQRTWFNAALAGGAIGLAVLCRPTFLPWLGLVATAMLIFSRWNIAEQGARNAESARKARPWLRVIGSYTNVVPLVVVAFALWLPWIIRNGDLCGKIIITTTHGGYTFRLANNEDFYRWLHSDKDLPWEPAGSIETPLIALYNNPFRRTYGQVEAECRSDSEYYNEAKRTIRDHPWDFLRACFYRIRQLWSPLPYRLTADESTARRMLRYATGAWYCGVYALAAVGVWRLRWKLLQPPWIWGLLLCLAFTVVHTFYWTNLRMRAPLMPFVALVAAAACPPFKAKPKIEN